MMGVKLVFTKQRQFVEVFDLGDITRFVSPEPPIDMVAHIKAMDDMLVAMVSVFGLPPRLDPQTWEDVKNDQANPDQ